MSFTLQFLATEYGLCLKLAPDSFDVCGSNPVPPPILITVAKYTIYLESQSDSLRIILENCLKITLKEKDVFKFYAFQQI